jgi:fatty-acyl-CoA synthase
VKGAGDTGGLGETLDYDTLLDGAPPTFAYPSSTTGRMAMCYTSGTTGNPKGVMYSHRSTYMHSMMITSTAGLALERDRPALVIVPMFHANAWGVPYAAWMIGADLIFPQQFLQAAPLPDHRGAAPTVRRGADGPQRHHATTRRDADLSSLRARLCGGLAVPRR